MSRKYDSITPVELPNGDADHMLFATAEGDVWLSLEDSGVFIAEGFDRGTAKQLETKFRDAQGHGPLQTASTPQTELTLGLSHLLPGIGMPRAAIVSAHHLLATH